MKVGMGWLGWTEVQTLEASMPAIELAYEGRQDMLRYTFGGGAPADAPAEDGPSRDDVAGKLKMALRSMK